MAVLENARRNHDRLFGSRSSALAETDPELIEYFTNFAFDETLTDAAGLDETLDVRTRLIVQLAAGGLGEFRALAAAAIEHCRVSPVEPKEIVYQSIAYTGMARAYGYLRSTNEILTDAGVELPLPGQSASASRTRLEHGKQGASDDRRRTEHGGEEEQPDRGRREAPPALPHRQLLRRHRRSARPRYACWSPLRCSPRSAAPMPSSQATSARTPRSATPARRCWPS